MEYYDKYISQVKEIFDACKEIVSKYPKAFVADGLKYIDKFSPIENKAGNYICYMLPIWLQEPFNLDRKIVNEIAMATVFKMLYFCMQDDIIDGEENEDAIRLLPLINLFFLEFNQIYQKIFPGDSEFWIYFKRYLQDWAISIDFEKKTKHWQDINLTMEDLSILAKKAAPLKLSACGACILTDNMEYMKSLDQQIDKVLITLQLVDDWVDKYKDLKDNSITPVLGEIMKFSHVETLDKLEKININKAAFFSHIPKQIESIMLEKRQEIKELTKIDIPDLILFNEDLIKSMEKIISNIEFRKKEILKGGFYNSI